MKRALFIVVDQANPKADPFGPLINLLRKNGLLLPEEIISSGQSHVHLNPKAAQIVELLNKLAQGAQPGDVLLFCFYGHGEMMWSKSASGVMEIYDYIAAADTCHGEPTGEIHTQLKNVVTDKMMFDVVKNLDRRVNFTVVLHQAGREIGIETPQASLPDGYRDLASGSRSLYWVQKQQGAPAGPTMFVLTTKPKTSTEVAAPVTESLCSALVVGDGTGVTSYRGIERLFQNQSHVSFDSTLHHTDTDSLSDAFWDVPFLSSLTNQESHQLEPSLDTLLCYYYKSEAQKSKVMEYLVANRLTSASAILGSPDKVPIGIRRLLQSAPPPAVYCAP
eukprot:CAMPEP_0177652022 /NCGR_PEP_ID=MMETSP0447-20121125/12879_1 /TAXON_ID=0 /ORGANISM="Stygamoeba regulata, Strain BSH-02190019" /LENGTH=333 /DNA_ID=CAMNT_0019155181 /DNA_START=127 /DNA_END=1128 /DNA_ORIENTATION=+